MWVHNRLKWLNIEGKEQGLISPIGERCCHIRLCAKLQVMISFLKLSKITTKTYLEHIAGDNIILREYRGLKLKQ